jgi:hypothetical protein
MCLLERKVQREAKRGQKKATALEVKEQKHQEKAKKAMQKEQAEKAKQQQQQEADITKQQQKAKKATQSRRRSLWLLGKRQPHPKLPWYQSQ